MLMWVFISYYHMILVTVHVLTVLFCCTPVSIQVSATAADVERSFSLPASPQLILLGMYSGAHYESTLFSNEEWNQNSLRWYWTNMFGSHSTLYFIGDEPRTNSQWMISIEGHMVFQGIQPTVSGLTALFAIFYIFNLQYPDAASQTLEFIQR